MCIYFEFVIFWDGKIGVDLCVVGLVSFLVDYLFVRLDVVWLVCFFCVVFCVNDYECIDVVIFVVVVF